MRKLSEYEIYLNEEIHLLWRWIDDRLIIPDWIELEYRTYYWVRRLGCKLGRILRDTTVSQQFLDRMENIENIQYRKLRNISPDPKKCVETIVHELVNLNTKLKDSDMC